MKAPLGVDKPREERGMVEVFPVGEVQRLGGDDVGEERERIERQKDRAADHGDTMLA